MTNRLYNVVVFLFWLTMTGWLLVEKVLPSLLVGEPPDAQQMLAEAAELNQPVVWEVYVGPELVGWAASQATRAPESGGTVQTQVYLQRLPLDAALPATVRAMLNAFDSGGADLLSRAALDARSELSVDALGRPIAFRAVAAFGRSAPADEAAGAPLRADPPWLVLSADGRLEGEQFVLSLKPGGLTTRIDLPTDGLLGDFLAPPARLPGLRTGQTWSAPLYNPLAGPGQPLELLYAVVVGEELVRWNHAIVSAHKVEYRRDPGGSLTTQQQPRGKLWVDAQGRVIRQETPLPSGVQLALVLLPADAPRPSAVVLGAAEFESHWAAWVREFAGEATESASR